MYASFENKSIKNLTKILHEIKNVHSSKYTGG